MPPQTPESRREALKDVFLAARDCTRCGLAQTRTQVVFGAGNADADVMFVGEAPGRTEDERGLPFVGAAGRLLGDLLAGIGMSREDVFIANVLKCRPPQNRDPQPVEIDACQEWLFAQLDLIRPTVVATLGNFSTKLLRGDPTGITRLHGRPEERVIGPRRVRLLPLFHPAAALYTPSNVEVLREDFRRIPELLAMGPPPQPDAGMPVAVAEPEAVADGRPGPGPVPDEPEARLAPEAGVVPESGPEAEPGPERAPEPVPAAQLGLF